MLFDDAFEEDPEKKDRMALAKITIFYAVFILPIAYILFFVNNKAYFFNPYAWISVIIHEFGHFLFSIIGKTTYLHVLGGTLLEYLAPLMLVFIFGRQRRTAAIALILIACMGGALQYTATYMESASRPSGYAYLSGTPMTKDNHDWYFLLSRWGMLGKEAQLARDLRAFGEVLMLAGLAGATIGYYLLFKKKPKGTLFLMAGGFGASMAYFGVKMQWAQISYSAFGLIAAAAILIAGKFASKWLEGEWKKKK